MRKGSPDTTAGATSRRERRRMAAGCWRLKRRAVGGVCLGIVVGWSGRVAALGKDLLCGLALERAGCETCSEWNVWIHCMEREP